MSEARRFAVIGRPGRPLEEPGDARRGVPRARSAAHLRGRPRDGRRAAGDRQRAARRAYDGLNVTVPHKERVLRYVDDARRRRAHRGRRQHTRPSRGRRDRRAQHGRPGARGRVRRVAGPHARWQALPRARLGSGGAARAAVVALGVHLGVRDIVARARSFSERARREAFVATAPCPVTPQPWEPSASSETRASHWSRRRAPGCTAPTPAKRSRRGGVGRAAGGRGRDRRRVQPRATLRGSRRARPRLALRRRARNARAPGRSRLRAVARHRSTARGDAGGAPLAVDHPDRSSAGPLVSRPIHSYQVGRDARNAAPRVPAHRPAPRLPRHRADGAHPARRHRAHVPGQRRQPLFGVLTVSFVLAVVTGVTSCSYFVRREANLSELQADFVSKVSHELRTPLTSIRLFVETMERSRGDARRRTSARRARTETERLTQLIERLLDWGRMEAGRKQFDLREENDRRHRRRRVHAFRSFAGSPPELEFSRPTSNRACRRSTPTSKPWSTRSGTCSRTR
jgi:hypothetical protein